MYVGLFFIGGAFIYVCINDPNQIDVVTVSYTHLDVYKRQVYIFPATLFHEMDADGNIFRESEKGIEYLSNIGAYKSLAEQLVDGGYQTVRFETKNIRCV